ncbi:hypothetical protein QTP70_025691, partial [Hemibagrus guttatus]
SPRQCIDLYFDEQYAIEPSWECKFDHIEVRDGPFSSSPIIGRYCGQQSPMYVRSSGRYLWIKFVADSELEASGFSARYNFTQGKSYKHTKVPYVHRLNNEPDSNPEFKDVETPLTLQSKFIFATDITHSSEWICDMKYITACEFEMSGPEGIIESAMVEKESEALKSEAVDCKWFIQAAPGSKIYLRFLEYEMQNSNECKRNFVAVYDGSSSVEHLKNKFCSTVANDVMLLTSVGVIRMWADEGSRKSRFRILFTTFREPPCEEDTFFCHSNMCINRTLVCNGIQNCVYPWDENGCKEKRKATILDNMDHTNMTIIGVTCGVVLVLLTASIIIQIKQPRRKYLVRPDEFDPALLPEPLEPPHYELCALRSMASAEEFPGLRRSSSKCVHAHHCGSQASNGSRTDLNLSVLAETTSNPSRSIMVMKHSHSLEDTEVCELDDELEDESMEEQAWRSVNGHELSVHVQ